MQLNVRSLNDILSKGITAVQATYAGLFDLSPGTPGRAFLEAGASWALWLQAMILKVLGVTRLSTSHGIDCDTFVEDFGMQRLGGIQATGLVTLISLTPDTSSAVVPIGMVVKRPDGFEYTVTEDMSNPVWDRERSAYVRAAGINSITVPVQASIAGSLGNCDEGSICLLGTSISGIDTVTNNAAFTNGSDKETDAQLRARFRFFINATTTGTLASMISAAKLVQNGLYVDGEDNVDLDRSFFPGNALLWIDDGTGEISDSLLAACYSAVLRVAPSCTSFWVIRPQAFYIPVSLDVILQSGAPFSAVRQTIITNIDTYINTLTIGQNCSYAQVVNIALTASPYIREVRNVLVNHGTTDVESGKGIVIRAGTVTVNNVTPM